jgi:hypothetical protein
MITVSHIKELVSSYLHGPDTLESFAAKFAVLFYDIEETGDAAAIQLAYEIESKLAAMTAGFGSEDRFKNAMDVLIPSNHVLVQAFCYIGNQAPLKPLNYWVGAAGTVASFGPADIQLSGVFGLPVVLRQERQTSTNHPQLQSDLTA